MALPPTSSKLSSDANEVTTFKFDFPHFTGTHTGTLLSLDINSVAGGGTGLNSLTLNAVIIGNGTSSPTFISPGTAGNILTSNGTTWNSSAPTPSFSFQFFASSQVTTLSTVINASSLTTFSNSPAFTFTPTTTGTYKVYSSPTFNASGGFAVFRIFNTSGSGTLLYESYGENGGSGTAASCYLQSVYTLTSGTSYQFDIQGSNAGSGGSFDMDGRFAPFYMFAELCG